MAYTEDSIWRNRDTFLKGRDEIVEFLTKKWQKETKYKSVVTMPLIRVVIDPVGLQTHECRLRKELFSWNDEKIAVQFWYEYFDETEKSWYRCYGLGKS